MSATRKRDLRTGRSVWQARRAPAIATRPLRRDAKADVLVIGAGVSGILVADQLVDAGMDVMLIDRRAPIRGSTPASTALLQYEIDTPLIHLSDAIGRARAERVWRRSRLALDALRQRARALGVDADCVDRDSLYLDGGLLDEDGLRAEAEARRAAGFAVDFLAPGAVRARFGIGRRAALLSYDDLAADPQRLAAGFLRAAMARGARVHAPVEAREVQCLPGGVCVATDVGPMVRARALVFATGYELARGVPRRDHSIASTWALATRPQPRNLWPEQCFIWEACEPYLYLRTTPDGRIVCGGEDEDFSDAQTRDAMMDDKIATLESRLARLFPNVDPRADFAWTGSFGASENGTPSIGPVPRMKNCYAVMGYGGNGITFSMMAGQILRATIAGAGDLDAELFSFTRPL